MCNSNCKTSEKSSSGACPLSPVRSRRVAILLGAIFKILIGFGGSFSDKGAFPGGGVHFNKFHESSTRYLRG